ncbi:MAG: sulfite exporter TauE/SafE family protein [Planctomycetaceae bacterium]
MFSPLFEHGWLLPVAIGATLMFASFVQRLLGFGFALSTLSLLTFLFTTLREGSESIHLAILVMSVASLLPSSLVVTQFYRQIDRRRMLATLSGAMIGLPMGMIIFEEFSAVGLARMSGVLLLILVVDTLRRGTQPLDPPERNLTAIETSPTPEIAPKETRNNVDDSPPSSGTGPGIGWGLVAGGCAGVLHGAIGIPGPPIVLYGTRQSWTPNQFRAFASGALILVSYFKFGLFALRGHITTEVLAWAMWGIPCMLLGYWMAARLADRVSEKLFRLAVLLLVGVSGVGLLRYSPDELPEETTKVPSVAVGSE